MIGRVILGGIVGGIVMFVWGAASHMLLPLGEAGLKAIPNEDVVVAAISGNVTERAFYLFPSVDQSASPEQLGAWTEKYKKGPIGVLVYNPQGTDPMSPLQLGTELVSNIACALLAALLLARASGGLGGVIARAVFVGAIGLISSLAIDVSQWNWYSFPTAFTIAALVDQVVGFFLTGLVLGWLIKRPAA
jgi:hypothetical protein